MKTKTKSKTKPTILTASSLACLFGCARKYYLSYIEGWRRVRADEALRLGSGFHKGLEARANGMTYPLAMREVMQEVGNESVDAIMAGTISALLGGYYVRYATDKDVMTVEPEREFAVKFPFLRGVVLCGKMDGVVTFADGRVGIIEHKTTSQDIGVDADYWQYINRDQIALYKAAMERDGKRVDTIIYDVVRKPMIRPFKATPPEKRKYTKDGKLYANCHDADETADSWTERVSKEIAEKMDAYYARKEIPLLSSDMDKLARRLYAAVKLIKCYQSIEKSMIDSGAEAVEAWPKCGNQMVCKNCPFRGVCDTAEMPEGEWERGRAHEELEIVKEYK